MRSREKVQPFFNFLFSLRVNTHNLWSTVYFSLSMASYALHPASAIDQIISTTINNQHTDTIEHVSTITR